MLKLNNLIRIFILFIGFIFLISYLSEGATYGNELNQGKNQIVLERQIYASELVNLNPEINYISYFDEQKNRSVGYVNVFGGIGENFLIVKDEIYEISVSKNITLRIR